MNLVRHYGTLWYYARHRFQGNNYDAMQGYFAGLLVEDLRRDFGVSLDGRDVLEVGGHTGKYAAHISDCCQARCINVELEDVGSFRDRFETLVRGDGTMLPVRSGSFDFVLCRGVLEHVPRERQAHMVQECYRALRPGGHCFLNTQPWYSPFAGHQLRPFHVLPFPVAKRLSNLAKPNRIDGRSLADLDPPLYPITMRRLHALIQDAGFVVLGIKDYHVRMQFVTKVPWLREILTQSVSYVLQKGEIEGT